MLGAGADGAALAAAAQEFGQQDDITVLTVTRLAASHQSTGQLTAQALEPA